MWTYVQKQTKKQWNVHFLFLSSRVLKQISKHFNTKLDLMYVKKIKKRMMHVWGPKIMKTTNMYVQTEWNVLNRSVKSVRARASVRCYDDEPERRRVNVVATSNQRHAGFDKVSVGGKNMENRASRMYRHAISWKWHEEGKKKSQSTSGAATGHPQTKTIQGLGTPPLAQVGTDVPSPIKSAPVRFFNKHFA